MKPAFLLPALLLFGAVHPSHGLSHSRSYQWSFQHPNLVANWSFENPLDFWTDVPASNLLLNPRFKAAGTEVGSAKSGSFVAQAKTSGSYSGPAHRALQSAVFRIPPGTYTLSFFYKSVGSVSGSIQPDVEWASSPEGSFTPITGTSYGSSSTWTLFRLPFTLPAQAQYLRITLAKFQNGASATFYFDDVVLEEGDLTLAVAKARRDSIAEVTSFGDALGRAHQVQSKIDSSKFLVGGTGYDDFARPETTFLPTPISSADLNPSTSLLSFAQNYYDDGGPFNTRGYPFSRVKYAEEMGGRIVESTSPDSAWQFGKGHTVKQGFYYVNDTLVPSNIENPSTNNAECKYRFEWSKSPDSSFTLTWTNKLGQVVRTAQNINRSSSGANTWKWSTVRYEYYPSGTVRKVRSPINDSIGSGETFTEVNLYDAQGQVLGSYSPDRNLRKFWYNRLGQLRYSQDSLQRAACQTTCKYTYFEYDDQGRPISEGVHTVSSLPQDSIDKDIYSQGAKVEHIGYIYDDTTGFQARTGFTLLNVLGYWKFTFGVTYSQGRLVCKYHRNPESAVPGFSSLDRFVADFFQYDKEGQVKSNFKFIGPIRDPVKRIQDVWYTYDARGRLKNFTHYASLSEMDTSNSQTYSYDFMGRAHAITGKNGKPLARYVYNDWGSLDEVELGGLPSGDSSTAISYLYNSQGGAKEIWATGSYNMGGSIQRIFQQFLGYENKAYGASGVPALIQPRFDGTITQQVYKYTSDLDSLRPVRATNYGYDQLSRMRLAQAYWNTNASPLNGSTQDIQSGLTLDTTGSLSTKMDYDLNGRILGQRSAGVGPADSAKYYYQNNSYRLDRVTGKLASSSTRNMSTSGTFEYDPNGALTRDRSKRLRVNYGWDGLPVSFAVDSVAPYGTLRCCTYDATRMPKHFKVQYPTLSQHHLYDADGNRVSRVEVESKPNLRKSSTHYAFMAPGVLKEWTEEYHLSGRVKKAGGTVNLYGRGAVIGRIRSDGKYDFFVKNYLGSTMLTVDDRGRYSDGRAHDYLAYGSYKDLKVNGSEEVTQKFTGKEFEVLTGLYAFGWRWQDPELGMWLSPDPVREYFNPYSYVGNNVPNLTDPSGLCADDNPDCVTMPTVTCTCDDGVCTPSPCDDEPVQGGPLETVVGVAALVFVVPALIACIIWCDDDDDDRGGDGRGGGGKKKDPGPSTPAGNGGGDAAPINRTTFDNYWNQGIQKIDQSRTWANGESYVRYEDVPQYLSGVWDLTRALPHYAGDPDPNVTYAIPSPIWPSGPGGASGLARAGGSSSRALGRALEAAGYSRPLQSAAHHIVAQEALAAAQARAILTKFGIGIDDAVNGVFLPANKAASNAAGATVHSTIHTPEYYQTVNQMLGAATSKAEAIGVLEALRKMLLSGGRGY